MSSMQTQTDIWVKDLMKAQKLCDLLCEIWRQSREAMVEDGETFPGEYSVDDDLIEQRPERNADGQVLVFSVKVVSLVTRD